ncbi:SHOCT domain-containing protein [Paenibacillus contaminans]|uniref:Uncharacterized protein n=1 Tax=Paenibacillus contaminans TaxID=450362 RepID=A0A329MSY0_9BACL|nr:SHOCT domain-containing protein [Paenibacillus contaminans]RAV22650.1 hypothetical protein DQG23_00065 [Paenibacillus contaminans]
MRKGHIYSTTIDNGYLSLFYIPEEKMLIVEHPQLITRKMGFVEFYYQFLNELYERGVITKEQYERISDSKVSVLAEIINITRNS